jgi:hypothetical protein
MRFRTSLVAVIPTYIMIITLPATVPAVAGLVPVEVPFWGTCAGRITRI